MTARALLTVLAEDQAGNVRAGVPVRVYESDQVTPVAQSLYAAASGGSPLVQPLTTDVLGRVTVYAATPQRVSVKVGTNTFYVDELRPDPADEALRGLIFDADVASGAAINPNKLGAGTLGGTSGLAIGANSILTPAATAPWRMRTTDSNEALAAEWIGPRTAMARMLDFNEASADSCVWQIQIIEDNQLNPPTVTARTGLDIQAYTGPDRGESSGLVVVQSGGGGSAVTYKTHRLRPIGRPNQAYTAQAGIETGSDDFGPAVFMQAGLNTGRAPADPDPTLTGTISNVGAVATIGVTDGSKYPVPGSAVPRYGNSSPVGTLWPATLYVLIDSEFFSYTGVAGNTLTGVTRAAPNTNTVAAAHSIGASVIWRTFNHASRARLGTSGSKGHIVYGSDLVFDGRIAYGVAVPVDGAPLDTAYTFSVTLAGALSAATSVSSAVVNAVNYSGTAMALTGGLSVGGQMVLSGVSSVALTADTNNWAPAGLATARLIRITNTGGPWTLTGMVAPTGPVAQVVTLRNVGATNVVLAYNSGSSSAGNRFLLAGGANVTIRPQGAITLTYDVTSAAWAVLDSQ
jgi:hypothetical protein